jgi:predicted ATPase
MNEQLIVKNFGPIKDATVDFKRVTVFIGPTGGGKSTLAKLAAICKDSYLVINENNIETELLKSYALENYINNTSSFRWLDGEDELIFQGNLKFDASQKKNNYFTKFINSVKQDLLHTEDFSSKLKVYAEIRNQTKDSDKNEKVIALAQELMGMLIAKTSLSQAQYVPSDRAFVTSINSSFAGLMRDDIGLSKPLLDFTNAYIQSRDKIEHLEINFLGIDYFRHDNKDYISSLTDAKRNALLLSETASGIQSVTPLLVLLEHLSRNTEQAQSFIIEEPELNLYPTAQQGLLNWLVEKCTQGENDLTITTHSPYILSSCNLLLEAYKVAQLRPDLEDEIAAIVPKACWLNPDEFAAYYVADGTVTPITDERTHLIGGNELDAVSGDISDSFRKLLRLKKQAV